MSQETTRDAKAVSVGAYKTILRSVLDRRPSGTRQRLANALGKNRSFISLISNPSYPVPIPAPHLEVIFDVCHFSSDEKRAFLESFGRAHPNRARRARSGPNRRTLRLEVSDLGDEKRNREFDNLVLDLARRLEKLMLRLD